MLGIIKVSVLSQNLWESLPNILSECDMELMDRLEEVASSELRIDKVDRFREASFELIEQIWVVDKEAI